MPKSILESLDRSVNGVNRFISNSVPFGRPIEAYQDDGFAVRLCSESELIKVAEELVALMMKGVPAPQAENVEQSLQGLLEIFSSPEVLLGAHELCRATIDAIRPTFEKLYAEERPLRFTLLGYPHKMPNPLYSISTGADLGEVVSLMKISRLMEKVAKVYPFGVKLHVLTENTIFHDMSDISEEEQHRYFLDLCRLAKLVDPSEFLQVEDIVAYHTPALESEWKAVTGEFKRGYLEGDSAIIDMVASVMPTNFMTLNYRRFPREILTRLLDPSCHDREFEDERRRRYTRALDESFAYLAYHQARYRLGFMDQMFPDTLRLTVAPKIGSFGVRMLNQHSALLPYYGYVLRQGPEFSFHYLVDIPRRATAVYDISRLEYPMYFEL